MFRKYKRFLLKDFLYKQKDILALLHKRGVATFTAPSFSEAVSRGQIPYHYEDGKKTKSYIYDEVVEAITRAGIGNSARLSASHDKKKKKKDKTKKFKEAVARLDKLPEPDVNQTPKEYADDANIPTDISTITDANIYKTIYQGKLEKLKYEKAMGELISRDDVQNKAFATARIIRDKLLSIPERLSNELATMNDPYIIKEMLYKEVNLLLEDLSTTSLYDDGNIT